MVLGYFSTSFFAPGAQPLVDHDKMCNNSGQFKQFPMGY